MSRGTWTTSRLSGVTLTRISVTRSWKGRSKPRWRRGSAVELISILEKVEAYNLDAKRFAGELRELSDAMDAELSWYSDEINREWGLVDPEQGDCGDHDATSE